MATVRPDRKCTGGARGQYCGRTAIFICTNAEQLQWFACDAHTEGAATEPIDAWFQRHGLTVEGSSPPPAGMVVEVSDHAAKIAEYRDAVVAAGVACRLLMTHDIAGLLRAIEKAETLGPLLDPALWRLKSQAMAEDKALLMAACSLSEFGKAMQARTQK